MSSEAIMAEFVGGPMDGQQRCLESSANEVIFFETDLAVVDDAGKVKVIKHKYERRSTESIFVRLPNGFFPFDWKGGEA